MKNKNLEMRMGGLNCDVCDYRDDSIPVKAYRFWVNQPCPKCGANLLTEADYKAVKLLQRVVRIVNLIPIRLIKAICGMEHGIHRAAGRVHFDGSGVPRFAVLLTSDK